MNDNNEPSSGKEAAPAGRRDAIVAAATGVFLRYGYRKTSMDDVARAAGISRQGLYLHFPNKEELFKEGILRLAARGRVAVREALARADLAVEDRLLGAFIALKSQDDGSDMPLEHVAELMATAARLVGPAIRELDQALVDELARTLQSSGVAALWKETGFTARQLAEHLQAASHGIKQQARTTADYKARMRAAVCLVCRASLKPRGGGGRDNTATRRARAP